MIYFVIKSGGKSCRKRSNTVSNDKIIAMITAESGLPANKVASTVGLLDDDKTIPFIARYRKEVTGELDEVQIRKIDELLKFYRSLEQKKRRSAPAH